VVRNVKDGMARRFMGVELGTHAGHVVFDSCVEKTRTFRYCKDTGVSSMCTSYCHFLLLVILSS